ncbi:MAG: hypothetical protein KJP21_02535 [Bacteroidia bacterium]|nr:hypothetical protein [Bacteroidia bacterium]NNJ55970.1 hypothetical protein [Bacteroidia bacterium]
MTLIDFFIGFFLMNAMPHFILGKWNQRMLSGFGYGDKANQLYSLANIAISLGLFIYQYGTTGFLENGIYVGALTIILAFYVLGGLWKKLFTHR